MCGAVRLRYCAGAVEVRSWYTLGSLLVRSWFAREFDWRIGTVRYGTRFSPLAVGKHARMHGMHGQYADVKTSTTLALMPSLSSSFWIDDNSRPCSEKNKIRCFVYKIFSCENIKRAQATCEL